MMRCYVVPHAMCFRYVPRPLLWHGKKFHFRCYSLLRADMSAFLYKKGFIICAGLPYDLSPPSAANNNSNSNNKNSSASGNFPPQSEMNKHLTNLSINKKIEGHPGLVPCLMSEECPTVSYTYDETQKVQIH